MGRALVAGLAAFAILFAAPVAWASFHSAPVGRGNATIRTAPLNVTVVAGGIALYPGAASDDVTIHVANRTSGDLVISDETLSVAASGSGNAIDGLTGNPITGCRAAWFRVTQPAQSRYAIAGGGSQDIKGGAVALTESGTDQTACSGRTPSITAAVS